MSTMSWVILLLFGIIFALVSLPNHYCFRTYALDLGMFNHALYDFAHLRSNTFMLSVDGSEVPYLGDHFSPITWIYAPLYYVFGSWTLLIVQILAILIGARGVHLFARDLHEHRPWMPVLIMLQFLLCWGIFSALSFDFHNNVITAMALPWLILAYRRGSMLMFSISLAVMCLSKENMALWAVFILLALSIRSFIKRDTAWKKYVTLSVVVAAYFLLVTSWVMPQLRQGEGMDQLSRFAAYGPDLSSIIWYMLTHPFEIVHDILHNTTGEAFYDGIKEEFNFALLMSGGVLLLFRPLYALMLVPVYLTKMISSDTALWGISGQYSIEFVPVLSLCLAEVSSSIRQNGLSSSLTIIAVISTAWVTSEKLESRKALWYDRTMADPRYAAHYESYYDREKVMEALELIPDNAILCSGSALAPHLAFRDRIYLFPNVKDAEYIALLTGPTSSYPIHPDDYSNEINNWRQLSHWMIVHDRDGLLILKKHSDL